jgi:hypothetical protein
VDQRLPTGGLRLLVVLVTAASTVLLASSAPAYAVEPVNACDSAPAGANNIYRGASTFGMNTSDGCGEANQASWSSRTA